MGALTDYYVDPSINANSGIGTIGDPFGDLQYALDTVTRDATNGDQFNVKAGTSEIMAATISWASYGSPASGAPCIFRGYTSTKGDGGRGVVDGNGGNFNIFDGSKSYVIFRDMELTNTGSASVAKFGAAGCGFINCLIHGTTSYGLQDNTSSGFAIANHVYDFDADGILLNKGVITDNFIVCDNAANRAINDPAGTATDVLVIERNIVYINGVDCNGIIVGSERLCLVSQNSVFTNFAGTKRGINLKGASGSFCRSNLVEGFSGVGGAGIEISTDIYSIENNSTYNCETSIDSSAGDLYFSENNEALGASPFAKSGSPTFANRFTYFAPVDTGSVYGGAYVGA